MRSRSLIFVDPDYVKVVNPTLRTGMVQVFVDRKVVKSILIASEDVLSLPMKDVHKFKIRIRVGKKVLDVYDILDKDMVCREDFMKPDGKVFDLVKYKKYHRDADVIKSKIEEINSWKKQLEITQSKRNL